MRYILDIIKGAISLLSGMGVTIKAFFSPVVTVQYPRETINISPRFRGHTKLVGDEENPDRTKCIVCGMCERNCPSHSIQKVEGEKREGEKKKTLTSYILNLQHAVSAESASSRARQTLSRFRQITTLQALTVMIFTMTS